MPELEAPIHVERATLGGALRGGPLLVPNHQREYSWKPARVRKLFEDLNSALVKGLPSYFLGSVVLTPGKPPRVIDGQQRLATTCIFLAAVRDRYLKLKNEGAAKAIEESFLWRYDFRQDGDVPRLTMNIDDRAYMQDRVLSRPDDRDEEVQEPRLYSHRLINHAAKIAAERVRNIVESADTPHRQAEALNEWVEYIDQNAIFVMLTPPNAARAYQMFKTLNDRAQRATHADMIKNHLFEHADDHVEEAQTKWSCMRTTIEGLDQATADDPILIYLHHVSIVLYGQIKKDDIFEEMERRVTGRANALRLLDALASYASDYAAIVTPTHGKWGSYDARVGTSIDSISQQMRFVFIRPLMLAVAARFTPTEANKVFRDLVSWTVRFLVAGGHRSGVVEKALGETANAIHTKKIRTAKQLADAFIKVVPNDTKFCSAFRTKTMNNSRIVRWLLLELEAQARAGTTSELETPVPDPDLLTVEHVLPLNPEAAGWDYYSEDDRSVLCDRLGNQVLLDKKDNGAMGDKPFGAKRLFFERSRNIVLTRDVIDRTAGSPTQWTPSNILERQKRLAELARKRWPLSLKK